MQIFRCKSIDNNTFSRNSSQFFENSSQIPCTFQSYYLPLPSLELTCGALRMNKGRDDMFKPNQLFLNVVGLFFAHNLPHRYKGISPFVHAEHSA